MRIQMKQTKPGSPNGRTTEVFNKDEIYDVPESLGKVFLELKYATEVPVSVRVEKGASTAPENKAVGKAPDDKKPEPEKKKKGVVETLKEKVKGKG